MSDYLKKLRETRQLREYAHRSRVPQKHTISTPIDAGNYKERLPLGLACVIEQAARAAYECLRQLSRENEQWPAFDEDQARADVFINLTLQYYEHPAANAVVMQNRWSDHLMASGWTYGEQYDAEKKISPYLVPATELPDLERAKINAFFGVCLAIVKPFTK